MITIPSRLFAVLILLASFCVSCSKKDNSDKIEDMRKAAEQGNADAQYFLGHAYANAKGVGMDQVEAAKWFRKAAEQGDASAQLNIGFAYANGEGVAKDQAEAVKWYRKAAEQGDYLGQRQLGFAYRFGDGVAKDQVEAYAWYNLVAVTHENAKEVREELEKTMTAQQIAEGQKRSTELSTLIEANKAKK